MSSFSDKIALFQNSSIKNNNSNKTKENTNKNKFNENNRMLKLDDNKVENKEKEDNKDKKIPNNSKKINNISINDVCDNNINKNHEDKNKINSKQSDIQKNLLIFENKGKNNSSIMNRNLMEETLKEKVSKNSLNNKKELSNQINLGVKNETINKVDNNINQNNNSINIKNRLNFFESKAKSIEIKNENKQNNREIKNKGKETKEISQNPNTDNKIQDIKNNTQKINSIEIIDNSFKSCNTFNVRSKINNINNFLNQKNNDIVPLERKSLIIKHKPFNNKNIQSNKDSEENTRKKEDNKDKDITQQISYINNKITTATKIEEIDDREEKDEKKESNTNINNGNILKQESNQEIKSNKENNTTKRNLSNEMETSINSNSDIILSKKTIPESVTNDTFCMAFFISSFNLKQPKIIEKSDELVADCGHSFCSSLPAIVPEIFARYPQNDTKDFEISELGASICFPNGIKLCFDKNEMHVNGLKNYSSMLTNQVGKRYFITTYHLYFRYSYEEFINESEYANLIDKTLLQATRVQYVYIPFCICFFSKYPFFNEMEKCLESLRISISNYKSNPNEIYNILLYLIKSIPIPPVGTKLSFPIPYYPELISINQPIYKDYLLFGDNPSIIFEYLSVEEIILIIRLLLFEQKVLLVGNNYDIISQIAFNFSLLLYPMQWVHTFIPIMTQKMMRYLDSFLPFFNGMHISLYELASGILENIQENIFIFDFNKHNFEMNTFPNLNSKNVIKKINELVPQFPKNVLNNINFGLGVIKAYLDKSKNTNKSPEEIKGINIKIKQIFIQSFIEILYDYKTYLSIVNEKPIFNTKAMLEKKPKADYKFYKELSETQLFQVFIQNNPVNKKANTFFEEQFEIYDNLKDKKDFKEEFINNYNITCEIDENYFIPLDTLKTLDINNQKKIKEDLKLDEYKKFLKKIYIKYDKYFNPKSILKFNKTIISDLFEFDHNKFDQNVNYYIIPNLKFNFEVEKRRKTIRQKSIINNKSKNDKEKELTPEEKDEIRENITDVITKIFKNDKISEPDENEKLVLDSLNDDYGRDLYINSLFHNKSILYQESFDFLEKLILSSINKIISAKISNEKKIYYVSHLIKSCDNFTKDKKSLSEVLYPKLDKIMMINDINFWKEYAKLYIEENCNKNMANDDKWVECLERIEKIMPVMGLKKTMIYSTLADIGKNNIEESRFSDLMKDVTSRLKIFDI